MSVSLVIALANVFLIWYFIKSLDAEKKDFYQDEKVEEGFKPQNVKLRKGYGFERLISNKNLVQAASNMNYQKLRKSNTEKEWHRSHTEKEWLKEKK